VDFCSCNSDIEGKLFSLASLDVVPKGTAPMFVEDNKRRKFEYNPCTGFSCSYDQDASVCVFNSERAAITLGKQNTAHFIDQEDPDEIIIRYSTPFQGYTVDALIQCARGVSGKLHILNVSFTVERLKQSRGGTAGNIAYTMRLLGAEPIVVSALGKDGGEYIDTFQNLGIVTDHILQDPAIFSAAAYITTDRDDNQISAFFPGPLASAGEIKLNTVTPRPELVLICPTYREVMIRRGQGWIGSRPWCAPSRRAVPKVSGPTKESPRALDDAPPLFICINVRSLNSA
jgi:hypothetical protein